MNLISTIMDHVAEEVDDRISEFRFNQWRNRQAKKWDKQQATARKTIIAGIRSQGRI